MTSFKLQRAAILTAARVTLIAVLATTLQSTASAQISSNLSFGSTAGTFGFGSGDITNAGSSGANLTAGPFAFDIYSGTSAGTITTGTDGIDDIFFSFETIEAFDVYGSATVLDSLKGTTHDQTQSTSGLRGDIPINRSGSNNSSTGDVAGHRVTVTFGSHLDIFASNFDTLLTSVNTAGEVFESTSIEFLDQAGAAFGAATYDGFYATAPLGAGGVAGAAINTNPFTVSGTGVYVADDTSVVDVTTDPFNPVGTTNPPTDNFDPNAATDGGLASSTLVGGFVYTTYLEDVAQTNLEGEITTSRTNFTSTLNGVEVVIEENVVPEPSSATLLGILMLGGLAHSRRKS